MKKVLSVIALFCVLSIIGYNIIQNESKADEPVEENAGENDEKEDGLRESQEMDF